MTIMHRNDLEHTYLEMLQFNINVDSGIYTKYYFDLRTIAQEVCACRNAINLLLYIMSSFRMTSRFHWSH